MNVHEEIMRRGAQYPRHSQNGIADPVVWAKLFYPLAAATWYVVEYDSEEQLAYGYVMGLGGDEWGYFSVAELVATKLCGVFPVEVDLHFIPKRASALGIPC